MSKRRRRRSSGWINGWMDGWIDLWVDGAWRYGLFWLLCLFNCTLTPRERFRGPEPHKVQALVAVGGMWRTRWPGGTMQMDAHAVELGGALHLHRPGPLVDVWQERSAVTMPEYGEKLRVSLFNFCNAIHQWDGFSQVDVFRVYFCRINLGFFLCFSISIAWKWWKERQKLPRQPLVNAHLLLLPSTSSSSLHSHYPDHPPGHLEISNERR